MSFTVKILGIKPGARVDALVKMLSQVPGLSPQVVVQGLRKPPLSLPQLQSRTDALRLRKVLDELGAVTEIIFPQGENIEKSPTEIQSSTNPEANHITTAATTPIQGNPALSAKAKPQTPTQHHHEPTHHREMRPLEVRIHKPQKQLTKTQQIGIIVLLLVALLPLMYFSQSRPTPTPTRPTRTQTERAETAGSETNKEQPTAQENSPSPPSTPGQELSQTQKDAQKSHQLAIRQQQHGERLHQMAKESQDLAQGAKLLEEFLRYNPHNEEAWKELEERMQTLGDVPGAMRARQGKEQSEKVRLGLESIAKAFGTEVRAKVSTAEVHLQWQQGGVDLEQIQQSTLPAQIQRQHPEKAITLQSLEDGWQIRLLPGDMVP